MMSGVARRQLEPADRQAMAASAVRTGNAMEEYNGQISEKGLSLDKGMTSSAFEWPQEKKYYDNVLIKIQHNYKLIQIITYLLGFVLSTP